MAHPQPLHGNPPTAARPTEAMAAFPLTAFDIGALAVIGFSVLIGFLRGVIKETLTIVTWLGAGVVAFFAFPYGRELARRTIETEWLADAAALCVVFVVPLIALKVAAEIVADHIPGGTLGTVDRFAGAVFGAARGAVVVCVAYLALAVLAAPEDHPEWVKEALILPYVKDGAVLLTRLMPEGFAVRGLAAQLRMPRHGPGTLARATGGPATL
jgi:membrane protein required for colicin V production